MKIYRPHDLARFWLKVDQSAGPSGCWLWTGGQSDGYGSFSVRPATRQKQASYAHRVSYSILVGEIPPAKRVYHACANSLCVNPAHLFIKRQLSAAAERRNRRRALARVAADQPPEVLPA